MKRIILKVGGMSCQHCVKAVEQALSSLAGVQSVQVELANSRAILLCDENIFDIQNAEKAISEQGYEFMGLAE